MKCFATNTALILLFSITLLPACTSDNEEDLMGRDTCAETVSLDDDVLAIVNSNCAISGCHVTGEQSPDFSMKQNVLDRASRIRLRTQSGSMPPRSSGVTLTNEEVTTLGCWVDQGAMDN